MSYQASMIFETQLEKTGTKIPFGIHTACEVTSIEKGENFVDINFKDSEGRVHNKRLWDANGNYPRRDKDGNPTETKQEAIEREETQNLAHIVKLLHIFVGEEGIAKFPALEYDDFVEKAIKVLGPKFPTKKVNLKLIYDSEGIYSVFGNFPDYIEEYVEGQEPRIKFTKWELENRCSFKGDAQPKVEQPTMNKLAELY